MVCKFLLDFKMQNLKNKPVHGNRLTHLNSPSCHRPPICFSMFAGVSMCPSTLYRERYTSGWYVLDTNEHEHWCSCSFASNGALGPRKHDPSNLLLRNIKWIEASNNESLGRDETQRRCQHFSRGNIDRRSCFSPSLGSMDRCAINFHREGVLSFWISRTLAQRWGTGSPFS